MAARLTDKQKKKIIADYVELGSYNAVAKIHGVSRQTVKKHCINRCRNWTKIATKKRTKHGGHPFSHGKSKG